MRIARSAPQEISVVCNAVGKQLPPPFSPTFPARCPTIHCGRGTRASTNHRGSERWRQSRGRRGAARVTWWWWWSCRGRARPPTNMPSTTWGCCCTRHATPRHAGLRHATRLRGSCSVLSAATYARPPRPFHPLLVFHDPIVPADAAMPPPWLPSPDSPAPPISARRDLHWFPFVGR